MTTTGHTNNLRCSTKKLMQIVQRVDDNPPLNG